MIARPGWQTAAPGLRRLPNRSGNCYICSVKRSENPLLPLLLGRARAAVLSVLLPDPGQALHVRELARITGASPGSLHRELRLLAHAGLLERDPVGRQVFYRAATRHPQYAALAALVGDDPPRAGAAIAREPAVRGRSGHAWFSARRLAAVCRKHHVRRLTIFGSAARDELTNTSDVDLIVEFEQGHAPSFWESPGIEDDLSAVFDGRRIDLMPPEVLNNPFRRDAMLRDLRVLYEAPTK